MNLILIWIEDYDYVLENYYNLGLPKDWHMLELDEVKYGNRFTAHLLEPVEEWDQPNDPYCTRVRFAKDSPVWRKTLCVKA